MIPMARIPRRTPVVSRVLILAVFVIATIPQWFSTMGTGLESVMGHRSERSLESTSVPWAGYRFTYGPLGFVIAPLEIGSDLLHVIFFRLGLHALWWFSVAVLLFRIRGYAAPLSSPSLRRTAGSTTIPLAGT